jgi:hypothetical protein
MLGGVFTPNFALTYSNSKNNVKGWTQQLAENLCAYVISWAMAMIDCPNRMA